MFEHGAKRSTEQGMGMSRGRMMIKYKVLLRHSRGPQGGGQMGHGDQERGQVEIDL